MEERNINELIGKTLVSITGGKGDAEMTFTTIDGEQYQLYHAQDCCEWVLIDDVSGDINDLLNSPILKSECVTNSEENPEDFDDEEYQESFTWTFYNLATINGYVDIRWYGESNGYYSESVEFIKVGEDEKW